MEQQQLEVTSPDQVDNSDNKSNSSKISESKFLILYYPIGKNKQIFFRSERLLSIYVYRLQMFTSPKISNPNLYRVNVF